MVILMPVIESRQSLIENFQVYLQEVFVIGIKGCVVLAVIGRHRNRVTELFR